MSTPTLGLSNSENYQTNILLGNTLRPYLSNIQMNKGKINILINNKRKELLYQRIMNEQRITLKLEADSNGFSIRRERLKRKQ